MLPRKQIGYCLSPTSLCDKGTCPFQEVVFLKCLGIAIQFSLYAYRDILYGATVKTRLLFFTYL